MLLASHPRDTERRTIQRCQSEAALLLLVSVLDLQMANTNIQLSTASCGLQGWHVSTTCSLLQKVMRCCLHQA